jgi:5-methylcytosine-specific restriction endonuclease McrA
MSVYIPAALKRAVRERFGNRCAYCRTAEELTATHFEIEHIDPRSGGGESVFANLCLSCPMCNRFKSDHSSAPDPITATLVPLFHPQLQQWRDHFAWSLNATEIVGLSPVGRIIQAPSQVKRDSLSQPQGEPLSQSILRGNP